MDTTNSNTTQLTDGEFEDLETRYGAAEEAYYAIARAAGVGQRPLGGGRYMLVSITEEMQNAAARQHGHVAELTLWRELKAAYKPALRARRAGRGGGVMSFESAVTSAKNLDALLAVLNTPGIRDGEPTHTEERLMTHLPTYGGDEPASTHNVWSWDEKRLLVQRSEGFKLVPRDEARS